MSTVSPASSFAARETVFAQTKPFERSFVCASFRLTIVTFAGFVLTTNSP